MIIRISENFAKMLLTAHQIAISFRHRTVTPEHIFTALAKQEEFVEALKELNIDIEDITVTLLEHMSTLESVPADEAGEDFQPEMSAQFQELLARSALSALQFNARILTVPHLVSTLIILKEEAGPASS